jgi:NitT/TauT family transport system substrate-binding protein
VLVELNRRRLLGVAAASVAGAYRAAVLPALAQTADAVSIGIVHSTSETPLFIADKLGYFRDEGIAANFLGFDAAAKMVAPLGVGQLDVATGAPSAGLYNAVARGIDLKIVADKGSTPKGYGYAPILVRKALIDGGKYKSLRDLKGLRVAESAPGTAQALIVARALASAGLKYSDVEHVYLPFPDHQLAFDNASIDASVTVEPSATLATRSGVAVRVLADDVIYPNQELAVILYGGPFIKKSPTLGVRFMRAYIRGARYYNDALRNGKLQGPTARDVISIIAEYTPVKTVELISSMTPNGNDPNGRLNIDSLRSDLQFFRYQGLIEGLVTVEQAVDTSFVDRALKTLGRYRPR